jgi:hypothetical protein
MKQCGKNGRAEPRGSEYRHKTISNEACGAQKEIEQ